MNPGTLTDDELLRHYDELFRQHPATAELVERMRGNRTLIEDELDEARDELSAVKQALIDAENDRDNLAGALEDYLDDTSAANARAARKVLDSIK